MDPEYLVSPGGRLTIDSNGIHHIGIKPPDPMHNLTASVAVEHHKPKPEVAGGEPDFEVPDGAVIKVTRNGVLRVKVAGDEVTLVIAVDVETKVEEKRNIVKPERV